jgi:glycopeptide antibiotics resistance protein
MKVVEFIKRNISLFNVIAISIFLITLFNILKIRPEESAHGMVGSLLLGPLLFSFFLLLIDFLMRKTIKKESSLFIIQLLLILIIPFLVYYL